MGKCIEQVKIENFIELSRILENQGFFIQVRKNRQKLIFFHIVIIRAGIVNICRIESLEFENRKGYSSGILI
jgi:hypothetical protein